MSIFIKTSLAAALILCGSQSTLAGECAAKSGLTTVPLLELYTSEGCSSCPPVDKWMSGIKADKVTPLAFHVDYWDYLGGKDRGWKDRFSKAEYSDRQRKTAAFGGAGFVYTPQFVMNGRDFKGWDNSRLRDQIASSQNVASRANLTLNVVNEVGGDITLQASAQAVKPMDAKYSDIFIAIYENKLVSPVKAGENSGSTLKHDYVVRELFGAYQMTNQNTFSKSFTLKPEWKTRDGGAVIFVQNSQTGEILQSLALPFCKS